MERSDQIEAAQEIVTAFIRKANAHERMALEDLLNVDQSCSILLELIQLTLDEMPPIRMNEVV